MTFPSGLTGGGPIETARFTLAGRIFMPTAFPFAENPHVYGGFSLPCHP